MEKGRIMWMVRAGESARIIDEFVEKKIVAIGWKEVGDLTDAKEIIIVKEKLRIAYPDFKEGTIANAAGQLFRFRNEFEVGDSAISYDSNQRKYWIGKIISDYEYRPDEMEFPHLRKVQWEKQVNRDVLSTTSKYSLGSVMTVFKVKETTVEELFNDRVIFSTSNAGDEKNELIELRKDTEERAKEFIKDKLVKLSWQDMQDLIAGILRAMGYKTLVSSPGSDRGKDIVASPDGLGLIDPNIVVQVKHRTKGSMGAPEIRSFIAILKRNDRGIYVSTGGFTKEAKYEAERAGVSVTLIDIERLVLLIIQNYDMFDIDTRTLIPLKKIYWPISEDD